VKRIDVRALLDAPHWPPDRALDGILRTLMKRRELPLPARPPDPATLWPPFAAVPRDVLARCAVDRLGEAIMVEKLGLACCAKMTLFAATEEERMLYSMLAADEATHLFWLSHFLAERQPPSPFGTAPARSPAADSNRRPWCRRSPIERPRRLARAPALDLPSPPR